MSYFKAKMRQLRLRLGSASDPAGGAYRPLDGFKGPILLREARMEGKASEERREGRGREGEEGRQERRRGGEKGCVMAVGGWTPLLARETYIGIYTSTSHDRASIKQNRFSSHKLGYFIHVYKCIFGRRLHFSIAR